jgi:hypothetical protein
MPSVKDLLSPLDEVTTHGKEAPGSTDVSSPAALATQSKENLTIGSRPTSRSETNPKSNGSDLPEAAEERSSRHSPTSTPSEPTVPLNADGPVVIFGSSVAHG